MPWPRLLFLNGAEKGNQAPVYLPVSSYLRWRCSVYTASTISVWASGDERAHSVHNITGFHANNASTIRAPLFPPVDSTRDINH